MARKGSIELKIGNAQSNCCESMIAFWFELQKIDLQKIEKNCITLKKKLWEENREDIENFLHSHGLYIIQKPDENIVERITEEVHNLIFNSGYGSSMVKNSEYLVEKLGYSYQKLSSIFKKKKKITLEKYIIEQKIKRVKQLITEEDLSLSEIAYMMDYSSVQYLSAQFKTVTGISFTDFISKVHK